VISTDSFLAARAARPALLLAAGLCVAALAMSPGTARAGGDRDPGAAPAHAPVAAEPVPSATRASPFALDTEAEDWVERTLASLTLRQRVAQLVMPWVPGERAAPNSAEFRRMIRWVEEDQVGGLIVSRGPPAAIATRLNAAQARARVPLLISSDLESGPSMRLWPGGTYFPPAMAFAAADDVSYAREAGRITGREARAVGIHLALGPILDVNSNPENPIINVRSFGERPEQVARLANAWIEGARDAGLQAAGKHFPGHGNTDVDSHVGLPMIRVDPAELERVDLAPFRAAIAGGIHGILVGHIGAVGIDGPNAPPASVSPAVVDGLLRRQLGFDGLVITDALNMGAITRTYSVTEASILAILAGADILLQPPGTTQVIDGIVAAVRSGRLSQERIDESVRRVLSAKAVAGLHQGSGGRVDPGAVRNHVGVGRHRETSQQLSAASITLVRDRAELVPLAASARRVLHVTYSPAGVFPASGLTTELRSAGKTVDQVSVGDRTTAAQLTALKTRARAADVVVASSHLTPREYRALRMDGEFARTVEELAAAGVPVVAVSFGSPYVLSAFPSVSSYLVAWSGSDVSQRAAGRALVGRAPISGRLPVSIPPLHRAGDGVDRPGG
jgi:beta-N-acetylhexosaminidase